MKIVQSLWSKPSRKKENQSWTEHNKCGWYSRKHNYLAWTLSALQFRRYYDQVELVTDEEGYDLLIRKMQLPYTSVRVELDKINDYPRDLFAAGKLYAYSIQEEPFIHADADVFVWGRFEDELLASPLLCQSKEQGDFYNKYYSDIFFPMLRQFNYSPPVLDEFLIRHREIMAVNAGIIGGHDIAFIREYTRQAFEFIDRNMDKMPKIDVLYSNVIFEQFLLLALAEQKNKPVRYLNFNWDTQLSDIVDMASVPHKQQYIHLYASHKRMDYLVDCMEYQLQKDHPDHYYHVMNLIRTYQI